MFCWSFCSSSLNVCDNIEIPDIILPPDSLPLKITSSWIIFGLRYNKDSYG